MKNLFDQLMKYHSNVQDQKYKDILQPLPQEIERFLPKQTDYIQHQICVKDETKAKDRQKKRIICKQARRIRKFDTESSNSRDEDFSSNQTRRRGRTDRARKQPYPTKNFLPNSKGPHIEFLTDYISDQIYKHQFIIYLQKKDGISMKDYEALYQIPQFHEAFQSMFNSKFLYRELLLSRSNIKTKINHLRKLDVFEKAFRTQQFNKIN